MSDVASWAVEDGSAKVDPLPAAGVTHRTLARRPLGNPRAAFGIHRPRDARPQTHGCLSSAYCPIHEPSPGGMLFTGPSAPSIDEEAEVRPRWGRSWPWGRAQVRITFVWAYPLAGRLRGARACRMAGGPGSRRADAEGA